MSVENVDGASSSVGDESTRVAEPNGAGREARLEARKQRQNGVATSVYVENKNGGGWEEVK